jgi:peptide alpha-N-acetyltransferase
MQILRDLSWLQIHMRDIEGFMETRRQLLTLKPAQRAHWTAFALGAHLANDYQKALQILDQYEKTMEVCCFIII